MLLIDPENPSSRGNGEKQRAIAPDGTVYVGSFGSKLYAIETACGGLAASPWPMYHRNHRHSGSQAPITPPGGRLLGILSTLLGR